MLAKRIIACLDIRDGKVVKGISFKKHREVGDITALAQRYAEQGIDELVLYDITASCENRVLDYQWVESVARVIDIPFCVAGGIDSVQRGREILSRGADKLSINSPALANPRLISALSAEFGQQCVVVGVDSYHNPDSNLFQVYQYTGSTITSSATSWTTSAWVQEAKRLGAGEIVLNVMKQDGQQCGFAIDHVADITSQCPLPVVASGGAGSASDFIELFRRTKASAGLAASIFHYNTVSIASIKQQCKANKIEVRYD